MKDNCPPLMQSEEARAPWNEKEPTSVLVDCTVCYCMSKSMPVEVHIFNDSLKDISFIEEFKNDSNALGIPTLLQELKRLSEEKIEQLRTEGIMLDENDKGEEKRILKQIKYYQNIQKAAEDWVVDELDVCQE